MQLVGPDPSAPERSVLKETSITVSRSSHGGGDRLAKAGGFSLHTGVAAERGQQKKLERLARYVTRPARSEQRLSLTSQRLVRYELKTPSRDCNTHMFFEPVDFMGYVHLPHLGRGDLRSYKSVVLPICHGLARRDSNDEPRAGRALAPRAMTCYTTLEPCVMRMTA